MPGRLEVLTVNPHNDVATSVIFPVCIFPLAYLLSVS